MKTSKTKESGDTHSDFSSPFFKKIGAEGFFSSKKETRNPFFSPLHIQPKLIIGQPTDRYEEEANFMASKVLDNTPSSTRSRPLSNSSIKNTALPSIQLNSIKNLSQKKKKQITVLTELTKTRNFKQYFDTSQGKPPYYNLPKEIIAQFSSNTPVSMQKGLISIAEDVRDEDLFLNSTVTFNIDLSSLNKGNHTYRFTYVDKKIIIENLGPRNAEVLSQPEEVSQKKRAKDRKISLSFFGTKDEKTVYLALSFLNDNLLNRIEGLKIYRKSGSNPDNPKAPGRYDEKKHIVYLYDKIFASAIHEFKSNKGVVPSAVRLVLHELAHAVDLRPAQMAFKQYQATGKNLKKAISETGIKAYKASKPTANTAFRKAAKNDGVEPEKKSRKTSVGTKATLKGGITSYADTDWMELYAENFALYFADPEVLKNLRPNIFSYFSKFEKQTYTAPKLPAAKKPGKISI